MHNNLSIVKSLVKVLTRLLNSHVIGSLNVAGLIMVGFIPLQNRPASPVQNSAAAVRRLSAGGSL